MRFLRGSAAACGLLLLMRTLAAAPQTQIRAAGPPNLEGTWNSATTTPTERPAQFKDKPFFTPAEAAAWDRQFAERNAEPPTGARGGGVGTYNTFFREFGTHTVRTLRTSIVTDPPDGRIPSLTPEAAARKERRLKFMRADVAHPEEFGLQDQCLHFVTTGPPLLPYSYNSNYQFVQTREAFLIYAEMIHDARIVHMNRREHLPAAVRSYTGDSIGRWEGSTLVVDTTNFNDSGGFYGDAGGNFAFDRNLHVVERFSLLDADTLLYQFEIDNPTAFTRPWKGELTMDRAGSPIYEYACHEGNYSLPNMMRGFRAGEREAAERQPR